MPRLAEYRWLRGLRAASASFSTATSGEGISGLPNPMSITSRPVRRASSRNSLMIPKTYGGSPVMRRNSMLARLPDGLGHEADCFHGVLGLGVVVEGRQHAPPGSRRAQGEQAGGHLGDRPADQARAIAVAGPQVGQFGLVAADQRRAGPGDVGVPRPGLLQLLERRRPQVVGGAGLSGHRGGFGRV